MENRRHLPRHVSESSFTSYFTAESLFALERRKALFDRMWLVFVERAGIFLCDEP